jgi:DNA-binding transcriptional ArsR family regulator
MIFYLMLDLIKYIVKYRDMDSFHALSDRTRRSIMERLAQSGELTAGGIGGHFDMSAPAISQHLKVLREAKLVNVEKRAQQRVYSVNPEGLDMMEQWVSNMRYFWEAKLDALDAFLKKDEKLQKTKKRDYKKHRNDQD